MDWDHLRYTRRTIYTTLNEATAGATRKYVPRCYKVVLKRHQNPRDHKDMAIQRKDTTRVFARVFSGRTRKAGGRGYYAYVVLMDVILSET